MKFACPHCGQHLEAEQTVGVTGRCIACPACAQTFDVPAAAGAGSPDAGAAARAERVSELWAPTLTQAARPEVTLKDQPPRPAQPGGSVSARLNLRAKAVARADLDLKPPPDYELLRLLGEGGMGVVYEARQTAMDRSVALKMIRPTAARDSEGRNEFLSEAVATGDLAHPNIVPIHDLGINTDGVPFYAMKQVAGTSWKDVLAQKPRTENLEILMRVADAVAFAHSRGVIHRDLKPENVMLGDYGEVLVMDWGLAASFTEAGKADRLGAGHVVCGTPAYMAPEMAVGEAEKIGPASDIYLLGAILFEIVTGLHAHAGEDAMACLQAAAQNRIEPTGAKGELLDIALKAMATEPRERFLDVKSFQKAIRDYADHAQSLALAQHGREELEKATKRRDYDFFVEAMSAFKQAVQLWPDNGPARLGLREARLAYAQCAYERKDLDLAASQLDPRDVHHRDLRSKIRAAKEAREARQRRIRALTYGVAGLAAVIITVLSVSFVWIRSEQEKTLAQKQKAESALADFKAEQDRRRADRKRSAPAMVETARSLITQRDFDTALPTVETAIEYDADLSQARLIRAALLARAKAFADADEEFSEYARLTGGRQGTTMAALCRRAAREGVETVPLHELAPILNAMGEPALAAEFATSYRQRFDSWKQQITQAWPDLTASGIIDFRSNIAGDAPCLTIRERGASQVSELTPLRGIPLVNLYACQSRANDLTPLAGMPLRQLYMGLTRVSDLAPLIGAPLEELDIRSTGVGDLTPLAGMRLSRLEASNTQVADLTPLRGMPLKYLTLTSTLVVDLSPLERMPIEILDVGNTRVRDLSALRGMPLKRITFNRTNVADLSPLQGIPLEEIVCTACSELDLHDLSFFRQFPLKVLNIGFNLSVTNLAPLRGMHIEQLNLGTARVVDLSPLHGMPLKSLWIPQTLVTDLSPLRGMPLQELWISQTGVTDLSPLEGMPLKSLRLTPRIITNGWQIVRGLASIESIEAWEGTTHQILTPEEFWRRFDAGEFSPSLP